MFPPVFVTATRFPEDAATLPFGVSVLTAEDIARVGATTVNEAVMKLLGIPGRLDLNGGGDYALDLRAFGTTSDNNQVIVVDGIRISEPDIGGTRLAGIPISSVERIEVLRGSGTVLYGEGATGGVIVITTKAGKGVARRNQAQIYAAAGSDQLREVRADATLQMGDVSIDAATQRRKADNYRENSASDAKGSSLTAQWHGDVLRIGVRHATDTLDAGLPGALSPTAFAENPRQASKPEDRVAIRNERSALFAEADWGAWQLGLDVGWRRKELESDFISDGYFYDYNIDAKTWAARARHQATLGSAINKLVFGIDQGEWERAVTSTFGPSLGRQTNNAMYLKDDLMLVGGTRLSAGWRSERIDKTTSAVLEVVDRRQQAWEVGVLHPLSTTTTVYGRIGRSFRLANVDEFSFTTPNVELQPQTSRDVELGARWRKSASSAELRLYRSNLRNELGYDPAAVGPFSAFGFAGANVNFDPTRRQGAELEMTHAPTAALTLRLNGALRQSRFIDGPYAGNNVPLTSKNTLSLRADWTPAVAHTLGLGLNRVSAQNQDFDNLCTIPAHTTVDMRYGFRWSQVDLSLGVANLTDRSYYTQASGCVGGETSSIYPEAGRSVTLSLRWQWQ